MVPGIGGAGFNPAQMIDRMNDRFQRTDVNKDGAVSKDEMSAALKASGRNESVADRVFARMDTNGDGLITQREQMARVRAMTDKMSGMMSGINGRGSVDSIDAVVDQLSSPEEDVDTKNLLEEIRERFATQAWSRRSLSEVASMAYSRFAGINTRG